MAVLVSGASGFLGSRLVERLVADGQQVVALARRPVPESLAANPLLKWVVRDIAVQGLDSVELPPLEAVVHLAGATLGAGTDEAVFLRANEQTTVRLLQDVATQCDRFVLASSQVVYGNARHLSVTEDFPLVADGSAYACSKLNSENWARWFQRRHGGSYIALRLCGFIDGGGIVDYLIDKALKGQPIELFSHGKVCRDYLPSSEGIDVLMAAIAHRAAGGFLPVNVGSGQAVSALDLANAVCDELGSASPIELRPDPAPQGDFVFCIERARELFGFRPGNMVEAVRRYARSRTEKASGA